MTLRIVTYNVRYFGHRTRGLTATRAGVAAIAEAIAGLDPVPDVVLLQEVETRSMRSRWSMGGHATQLQALSAALEHALVAAEKSNRYVAYYFPAHTYGVTSAPVYTTGLAVLAAQDLRIEHHRSREITHRSTRALGWLKQSRLCAHLRLFDREGRGLDLFNTHLSLPAFASPEFWRRGQPRLGYGLNQTQELASLVRFIEETRVDDAYLVAGDFNALPDSPVYAGLLAQTGARDPFPEVVGMPALALRDAWPSAGFWRLRMRLDHVFVGPGVECLDFDESHPFGRPGRWDGLSDHVPLVGRFRLR